MTWPTSSLDIAQLHVAQLNVGRLRFEQDDPAVAEFVDALDTINFLGEKSPGFVWRYQDESGSAMDTRIFDDPRISSTTPSGNPSSNSRTSPTGASTSNTFAAASSGSNHTARRAM